MNTCNGVMQDTHIISEALAPTEQENQYKEAWCSTLKQNLEAYAARKEYMKEQ